jgi:hypothetical protein
MASGTMRPLFNAKFLGFRRLYRSVTARSGSANMIAPSPCFRRPFAVASTESDDSATIAMPRRSSSGRSSSHRRNSATQ